MTERTKTLTISVQETAEELGVCDKTVYDLVHTKDFPAIWIGHRVRISRAGLAEWVRANEQNRVEV